jgi:hypothetical protein
MSAQNHDGVSSHMEIGDVVFGEIGCEASAGTFVFIGIVKSDTVQN